MKNDEIDRILSEEDDIVPSSGFVPAVMEAVLYEAATPPPIPFPWKWALPGFAALAFAPLLFVVVPPPDAVAAIAVLSAVLEAASATEAGWIALAVVVPFVSVTLSMRLVRGRG